MRPSLREYKAMESGQKQRLRAPLSAPDSARSYWSSAKLLGRRVSQRLVSGLRVRSIKSDIAAGGLEIKSRQEQFSGLMADVEERFLAIGKNIEGVSGASETLVAISEEFLKLAAGQIDGKDQFTRAAEILQGPLAFLRDCQAWSAELVQELRARRGQIDHVCHLKSEIETVLSPLRYIQVLFRIESARLPVEIQNVFVTLTCDIEEIHSKAIESVKNEFAKLEGALQIIDKLIEKLDLRVEANKVALKQKQEAIEQSLRELSVSVSESQISDVRLCKTLQAVRAEVGQVVMGVQFQDITRQKLEGVDKAMAQLNRRMAEFARVDSAKRPQSLGQINEIARVQAGQLASVDCDLAGAQSTINEALKATLEKTVELDQDCLTIQNLLSVANADNGMVQIMLNALTEMRSLIRSAAALESEIYETICPLSDLATNLTAIVGQLSFDIKLIAINAQIQAAHLDSGTGLDVLSQKTCVISDAVNSLNEENGLQLGEMAGALNRVVENCGRFRGRAQEHQKLLNTDGAEVEAQLHVFRDRVLEDFHRVNEHSARLRARLGETIATTDFHQLAKPRLDAAIDSLKIVERLTAPWKDAAPKVEGQALKEQLRNDYRMHSQRMVHLEALNQKPGDQPQTQEQGTIELFEAPAAPGPADIASQARAPTPDGQPESKPESKPDDLGANVELF
jgi:hypothetical protein